MLMSVFKAPVAAAVLHGVDAGTLHLDQRVHLTPADVVAGSAVPSIGTRAAKGAIDVTVAELLLASVSQSDNTAVDALLKLLGGGPKVTAYLDGKGVHGMRIDVGEREIGQVFDGLADGTAVPVHETAQAKDARRRRGYEAAIAMPQNTTTLDGAATFLRKLQADEVVTPANPQYTEWKRDRRQYEAMLPAPFTERWSQSYAADAEFKPWTWITAAFLHANIAHIGLNMLAIGWLGGPVERYVGHLRYLGIYVVSGLAGSAGALVFTPASK
jgi:beta-lactamase class A